MLQPSSGILPRVYFSVKTKIDGNVKHLGNLAKQNSYQFRSYRGVAGIIQRRLVMAISIALFSGILIFLTGFFLRELQIIGLTEAIAFIGLTFLISLLFNGWLILRLTRQSLRSIERVEDSLVEIMNTGKVIPDQILSTDGYSATPFLQSFHSLLNHVDVIETKHLEFLARIAHDIRSPVATILGYSELLASPELRHNEKFIDQSYRVIRKQGNQVCQLVEEAVLAAEIDSGHLEFRFIEFDLKIFLGEIITEVSQQSGREIGFNPPTGDVHLMGDPIYLRKAVQYLIENAIKFSDPWSPVTVQLKSFQAKGWVLISVKDLGIGIDEKDQSNLFRRFSRIRNERTLDIPGNGLGLYIANRIVEAHQGTITLISKPNQGSTFTIQLLAVNHA